MTMTSRQSNNLSKTARRNVIILCVAQAVLGAQMVMIFTVAGLAGQSMASNICLATLPITATVFGSMLSSAPLSTLMHKYGRRAGFWLGCFCAMCGSLICSTAMYLHNFWLFVFGSCLFGVYMCSQGFLRFAATDAVDESFKPKAISYVLAGGLFAALIGRQLVVISIDAFGIPILGTYIAVIGINIFGLILFSFLHIEKPSLQESAQYSGRTRWEMIKDPKILAAMIIAMISYALMSLIMTSTPLAVVGCGYEKSDAADVVLAHVLAMYAPSFFTGHLIVRFGVKKIIGMGLVLLFCAGVTGISGFHLNNFFIALILVGLGWNFSFIGATTLLSHSHSPAERGKIQGLNDVVVFGGVTFASLASGALMNCSGGSATQGWQAVNLAMVPFLILAAAAIIWLRRHDTPHSGMKSQ